MLQHLSKNSKKKVTSTIVYKIESCPVFILKNTLISQLTVMLTLSTSATKLTVQSVFIYITFRNSMSFIMDITNTGKLASLAPFL